LAEGAAAPVKRKTGNPFLQREGVIIANCCVECKRNWHDEEMASISVKILTFRFKKDNSAMISIKGRNYLLLGGFGN
jgi:hypothetical protein|tara:strand:- start:756 stop:986 length:231 start_codon:yes stop_codon:yes gene_type:complete